MEVWNAIAAALRASVDDDLAPMFKFALAPVRREAHFAPRRRDRRDLGDAQLRSLLHHPI